MEFCQLPNRHNDCYLNSLVQLLLAAPGLVAAARAHLSMCGNSDATPACASWVFSKVLADCDSCKGGYSDSASLVAAFETLGIEHEHGSREDTYEVLAAIMNCCPDMMQPLFNLQPRTKVVCSQQRHSAVNTCILQQGSNRHISSSVCLLFSRRRNLLSHHTTHTMQCQTHIRISCMSIVISGL